MQHNVSTADLIQQLRRAGLKPTDRMIEAIRERGDEAIEPLLALALDTDSLFQPEPAGLGPIHALRLLGEFQPSEAAETILRRLPLMIDEQQTQAAFLWAQEAPQIVARFGAAALPEILRVADDMDAPPRQRGAGYAALSYLAVTTPDLRDQILDELRQRFSRETDRTAKGYLVASLAQLKARDLYPQIMEAFRNKDVDREIISAADARQMLLGTEVQAQLSCALHTLDERYQQHGPYSEEQQRAMAEMARNSGY
ncbi:MAG: DUF1186 domain-containing protein [Chloroflexi bacterium]|nr:DUF1186 domain-containing protein [Chloroflexota bacterium]